MNDQPTEITVLEDGSETHESWLRLTANRVSAPGTHLFDSEVAHLHYVQVCVSRCERRRDLNRDSIHQTTLLAKINLSMAQWGAFVSSFGQGGGVSATLAWLDGPVPAAPHESRLAVSAAEVRDAGAKALTEVGAARDKLTAAFERGAGKREMRDLMRDLDCAIANAPANMQFAADSLSRHTEDVVTKAKADIEAMVSAAQDSGAHTLPAASAPLLSAARVQR